ncbi:MAG TPA: hypothetical protein VFH89_14480 [Sphingomicrobium sp.]|nr:hypothetical protein [Sphingomicrobium sp.]
MFAVATGSVAPDIVMAAAVSMPADETDEAHFHSGSNWLPSANADHGDSRGGVVPLTSGRSLIREAYLAPDALPSNHGSTSTSGADHGNDFLKVLTGKRTGRSTAISGFEDHSVSVIGNDQTVTYDDSNVFISHSGPINANTGDTDSSGLNAVDIVGSRVRAGNSGDSEGGGDGDSEEAEEGSAQVGQEVIEDLKRFWKSARTFLIQPPAESGDEDEDGPGLGYGRYLGDTWGTVTDEGASLASGKDSLVVGADGYDDVSIRSRGDRDIVTYDDSNVVIGGEGKVNAQIGDSDTGGAVVMGIHNSDVEAGCEGDLCYSGGPRNPFDH